MVGSNDILASSSPFTTCTCIGSWSSEKKKNRRPKSSKIVGIPKAICYYYNTKVGINSFPSKNIYLKIFKMALIRDCGIPNAARDAVSIYSLVLSAL